MAAAMAVLLALQVTQQRSIRKSSDLRSDSITALAFQLEREFLRLRQALELHAQSEVPNRPLKKWASNASGTLFSKKRVAQTRLRSDCTGQSGLFAGHLAHFGRTYPRAHA